MTLITVKRFCAVIAGSLLMANAVRAAPDVPLERFISYWEAVEASDWATTWAMEMSRHQGTENPYGYYQGRKRSFPVLDVERGETRSEDDAVEIDVVLTVALPIADRRYIKKVPKRDRWVKVDGNWFHSDTKDPEGSEPEAAQGSAANASGDQQGPPEPAQAPTKPQ